MKAALDRRENQIDIKEENEREVKLLIRRIKDGDENAFTQLVHNYKSQVSSIAYKMVNDYDEAADIAQIVFLKMSKNLWRYDENKKFYTWLYRITVNASIDYIRKNKRHKHESFDQVYQANLKSKDDSDNLYKSNTLYKEINIAADTLNDKQRSAFILRDVEGSKISEVASIMKMPEATVRWYLHRARTKIKKELKRNCPKLLIMFGIK
ncbi:MAG: hypothetical protein DWP97_00805 [Calditrichaeota bacterium]|nr:MAG: hypothetical protein DWP97_00805 [Calditrichota bacterium]